MQLHKYTSSIQNLNIYTLINQIIGSSEQQQTEPGANGEWNTVQGHSLQINVSPRKKHVWDFFCPQIGNRQLVYGQRG
jgi:hypothetical protein